MNQKRFKYQFFIFLGLLLLNMPLFFDVYRTAAFNIVPHDNYAPYLLHLLGEGGSIPQSPTGYRLFSVWLAIPFYHILPLFKFTLLEGKSDVFLKALEALSFVTYLAVSIGSFLIYKLTKDRFNGSDLVSILAAFIAMLLFRFTAIYGVDPIAIMIIAFLIYHIQNKWVFAGLLLLSVGFNEKIIFFFWMLFTARMIFKESREYFYFGIASLALCSYFSLRYIVDLPGYEYMLQPSSYLGKAQHTIPLIFTAKGFYLNILPGVLIMGLYLIALKENRIRKSGNLLLFSKTDFLPVLGFFVIAIVTDLQLTIGRVLLFCFPLFLPLATLFIKRVLIPKYKQ